MDAKNLGRILWPALVVSTAGLFAEGSSFKSVAQIGVLKSSETPVEQARTNIQVLKGLPECELFPLMNSVASRGGIKNAKAAHRRLLFTEWPKYEESR